MGAKCPYCGRMLGVKESSKPIIDGVEWYNKMACASKECGRQWQTREMIVGRGKDAILKAREKAKQSKSRPPSSKRSTHLPANVDGTPSQIVRPATDSEMEFVNSARKKSLGASLLCLHTSVQASSKGTGK